MLYKRCLNLSGEYINPIKPDMLQATGMKIPPMMPRLKGYRFPREIVACAVWACHRFALRTADVEDLLAERGVIVSREEMA